MLSCKDVSKLLSDRLDRKLGFTERVRLRLHLAMCSACSRVEGQLGFLREALSRLARPTDRDQSDRK
jgi:predicted anti-sigma-YlaC factor YlaD